MSVSSLIEINMIQIEEEVNLAVISIKYLYVNCIQQSNNSIFRHDDVKRSKEWNSVFVKFYLVTGSVLS